MNGDKCRMCGQSKLCLGGAEHDWPVGPIATPATAEEASAIEDEALRRKATVQEDLWRKYQGACWECGSTAHLEVPVEEMPRTTDDHPACRFCGAREDGWCPEHSPEPRTSDAFSGRDCAACGLPHPMDPCAARRVAIDEGLAIGLGIDTKDLTEGQQFYTLDELCRVRAFALQEGLERGAAAIVGVTNMGLAINRWARTR